VAGGTRAQSWWAVIVHRHPSTSSGSRVQRRRGTMSTPRAGSAVAHGAGGRPGPNNGRLSKEPQADTSARWAALIIHSGLALSGPDRLGQPHHPRSSVATTGWEGLTSI